VSFSTIYQSVYDEALRARVTACCGQEGEADPDAAMNRVIWPVTTASDVEAAYASALAAGNPSPGGDESVITDGMILSHVQAALAAVQS
jgi:hypothetical protein